MTDDVTTNPQGAFEMLLAGSQRFVAGSPEHPNQDDFWRLYGPVGGLLSALDRWFGARDVGAARP